MSSTPSRVCQLIIYDLNFFWILYITLLYRTGKKGTLEVNGFSIVEGESQGILKMLNTQGNIYIGKLHSD